MKLAISNIAWPLDRDEAVAALLRRLGVAGIEVAPTKIWPSPIDATDAMLAEYRRRWEDRGIRIIAAQALLFGQPELTLFDDDATRQKTLDYLERIVRACGRLGCQSLVFGSPRNRQIGSRSRDDVWPIAVDFFTKLAEVAVREQTCVVLEANPLAYGADFIVRASEAIELVRAVDHPGLRLHLDTACMTLAEDDVATTFEQGYDLLRHFHISEPSLAPVGGGAVDHAVYAEQLRRRGYSRWISIEMRESTPFTLEGLAASIEYAKKIFA